MGEKKSVRETIFPFARLNATTIAATTTIVGHTTQVLLLASCYTLPLPQCTGTTMPVPSHDTKPRPSY